MGMNFGRGPIQPSTLSILLKFLLISYSLSESFLGFSGNTTYKKNGKFTN